MLHDASIVRRPVDPTPPTPVNELEYLWRGKFLGIRRENGWEFVERTNGRDVVAVIAVTPDDHLILTEQLRPPLGTYVIDLPAGLVGDESNNKDEPSNQSESAEEAGARELTEETGYTAHSLVLVDECATSPGLTNEKVKFMLAEGITQTSKGGGVGSECITTYAIPLSSIKKWRAEQRQLKKYIDPKVAVALEYLSSDEYLLRKQGDAK